MVVLHTHFALLYLRGGLCWDWGLACRRSTAIFTSENKSIQTLNTTVTWRSANDVHAKNGSGCVTVQMKQSARIQILKSKKDGSSKCRRFCRPICQIEFEMNPKWWTSFLRVKICKKLAELECIRFSSSNLGFRNSPNQKGDTSESALKYRTQQHCQNLKMHVCLYCWFASSKRKRRRRERKEKKKKKHRAFVVDQTLNVGVI